MQTITPRRSYGWIPSLPDSRDIWCVDTRRLGAFRRIAVPKQVDLRKFFPVCNDQGTLGSCTAQSASDALEYLNKINGRSRIDYSRLFIYYNSRDVKDRDVGATIRDTFKAIAKYGACRERIWPYDISHFAIEPPTEAYTDGEKHQALKYMRVVQNRQAIQRILAEGFPICFGFTVTESFEETSVNGIVPAPQGSTLGGHAVLLVGYEKGHYIVRNSWGPHFGDNGYCYFPYKYLEDRQYADDFWVVKRIEDEHDCNFSLWWHFANLFR